MEQHQRAEQLHRVGVELGLPAGERREEAWREQEAAKLAEQRAALAACEPVRCACCFQPITSSEDATEKHGSLVHRGDCEQEWGSETDREEAA